MQIKTSVIIIAVLVVAAPLATLATVFDHSAEAQNSSNSSISRSTIGALLKAPFTNTYNVITKGKTIPIKYSILGGEVVGMLPDPARHQLDIAVNPSPHGAALEVELPRHVIDSKGAENKDMPFRVIMDGHQLTGGPSSICFGSCPNQFNSFKETQNTNTDRVLFIIFGPNSRFVEIRGTTTPSL
jgi:hypothetical protein